MVACLDPVRTARELAKDIARNMEDDLRRALQRQAQAARGTDEDGFDNGEELAEEFDDGLGLEEENADPNETAWLLLKKQVKAAIKLADRATKDASRDLDRLLARKGNAARMSETQRAQAEATAYERVSQAKLVSTWVLPALGGVHGAWVGHMPG